MVTDAWVRGVGAGPKLAFASLLYGYLSTLGVPSTTLNSRGLLLAPIILSSAAFLIGSEANPLRFLWVQLPCIFCEVVVAGLVVREAISDVTGGNNKGGLVSKVFAGGLFSFTVRRAMTLL